MKKRLWIGIVLAFILLSFAVIATDHNDEKLSRSQATRDLRSWMEQPDATFRVIGVQQMPQLGGANVDFYMKNFRIGLPKNDAITAYALGPGGGTKIWTGNGHAIFKHYNKGWVLNEISIGRWSWNDIGADVK